MNFGEKFTELVNGCELTHQQLADVLGFKSKSNINYYMNRKKKPSADVLDRMCDYFGVTQDYFSDKAKPPQLRQVELEYQIAPDYIPVLSDESINAVQVGKLELSALGIHEGFVIVADERISSFGFPIGSSLYFSTNFDEASANIVIVQQGENRYFATCEHRGNNTVILPLDREKPAATLDKKTKSDIQVYAALQEMLVKPGLINLRR